MDKGKDSRSLVNIKFNDHTIVDEKKPFALYSISVLTHYSRINIVKRYSCFKSLSVQLLNFLQEEVPMRNGRKETVGGMLPAFPDTSLYFWNMDEEFLNGRKAELEQYSQALVDLFYKIAVITSKSQDNTEEMPYMDTKSKLNIN